MLTKITVLISLAASLSVAIVPASYAEHYHGGRTSAGAASQTPAAGAAFGYETQDAQPQPKTLHWIDNPQEPRG